MTDEAKFSQEQGIFIPIKRPLHRDDEYDEAGFEILIRMQRKHFWYRGRHKILLKVLQHELSRHFVNKNDLRAIDLGGGCGGWLEYLKSTDTGMFQQFALGDSSLRALSFAEPVVASFATRYQIDLLDLPWSEEWDVIFLLDVLEHIPRHREVLQQIRSSLRPGGLLFVTTPALNLFWSYNDELAHHQRRYCRQDFSVLGEQAGLELLRTDYFMFFLSPALLLSRILFRPSRSATADAIQDHLARTHQIPPHVINEFLYKIFSVESTMINSLRLPWGTSILAVFRR